jgi:hypothetical protein
MRFSRTMFAIGLLAAAAYGDFWFLRDPTSPPTSPLFRRTAELTAAELWSGW